MICDTEPQGVAVYDCINRDSCGLRDPVENFMDYSSDTCLTTFTEEQVREAAARPVAWVRMCIFRTCDCACTREIHDALHGRYMAVTWP